MKLIKTPLDPEEIRNLKVNEDFEITGKVFTARDAAHKKLLELPENEVPAFLKDCPCFHCGPVMKKDGEWKVISAGPTTSARMEIFEDKFMEKFGTLIFIGKGGMGDRTLNALKEHGAIYAQYTGGAGSLMAHSVKRVTDVLYLEELGIPEAIWVFEVERLGPLVVTMDSNGASLHKEVSKIVEKNLERIKKEL